MILADRIKVTLVAGGVTADVMNDVVEWDSFEILQERDDVSGVVTSVSFPLKLRNKGMKLLKSVFDRDGLYASGTLKVYQRGDHDNDYTLVKSSPLDFSTYEEHSDYVSIECSESELMDIINSEGKTKYDIPVKDIKEAKKWNYKRMTIRNIGVYTLPEDTDITGFVQLGGDNFQLSVTLNNASQAPGASEVDFRSQSFGTGSDNYFLKSTIKSVDFKVDLQCEISVEVEAYGIGADEGINGPFTFGIFKKGEGEWEKQISIDLSATSETGDIPGGGYRKSYHANLNMSTSVSNVAPGEMLCLMLTTPKSGSNFRITANISNPSKFEVYYYEASGNVADIDVISPERLLGEYLRRMSGDDRFSGHIEWESFPYDVMLVAAESLRGFGVAKGSPEATLHGSPNDFIEWLRVLGYEPVIDGNAIAFKARDKVFLPDVTAMELEEGEVADLIKQADSTHAYTSVEIGYDKQDYENENGKYEANGKFAYTTGYVASDDNKLSLISPYRADPLGMEFLCQERDNYTTDDKSDNDIFFVALVESGANYIEYKGIVTKADSGHIEMFNAPFNPYFLVSKNESLIGINAKVLKFKSTDMSREADIQGHDIYGDMEITKRLFLPVVYNFAAGHTKEMPSDNRDGLVKVAWHGETLLGYIKSVRKNYVTEEETTWELHAYKSSE